ncbi:MAG: CocE/NonD family hydrolase [Pirellulaceae bacterium]|nr:CocE/NonD family hydrolase [Pirellulaceae bacterium]
MKTVNTLYVATHRNRSRCASISRELISASMLLVILMPWPIYAEAPTLPLAIEKNVAVPMRDGVVLRADVFRPDGVGPWPVLVLRTPYGKDAQKVDSYVKAGYMVVRQDARGRYASDGKWESFYRFDTHDAEDGFDTVEWSAKLPGSNGKVGTYGVSYNAFLQWRLAALRPPSLVAMSARSIPARLTQLEGPGTIRPGRRLNWFYAGMSPDMRLRSGADGVKTKTEAGNLWKNGESQRLLEFLPWLDLPKEVFEDEDEAVKAWLREPHREPWQFVEKCSEINVPNLDICGWFDHCNDGIEMHQAMRRVGLTEIARNGQQLIIGPWSHSGAGARKVGSVDFGPSAALDTKQVEIRYFDYWLKGKANRVDQDAPVRIFVMGKNQWRDEQEWPPQRARTLSFYLDSQGHANTPTGDGVLTDKVPVPAHDSYRYDPKKPVPTLWSASLFTLPADQAPLVNRHDILVYQTEPLTAPMEVTGYPEVILHAASNAPDTDFFARLIDVAPDGTNRDIASGMVRARYRLEKPKLIKPGEVVEYRIKLRPTSNEFQTGHRIRLDITSSDFPNYDRNHNTAADQNADAKLEIAEQTIHHGSAKASRLILPVIANQSNDSRSVTQ